MRKIILLSTLALMLFACKSNSVTGSKPSISSQVAMKGEWILSSVTYPGSNYIKVNSFDIADSKCFEGSKWKFISNNNTGNMALANASCTDFSSPITWYVSKEGQFLMKILSAGEKAKKVREGYLLQVRDQRETSFQLVDQINVGGKMTDVVYQFNKVN